MGRVRVKICGVTRVEDAKRAASAGADAVGLVFYPQSPRALDVDTAAEIAAATPPFVARVALFLDADAKHVDDVIRHVRPDVLQFHGIESPAFCAQFGLTYIKTVPMGEPDIDLADWAARYADAGALLLDANRAGAAGGQGRAFAVPEPIARVDKPTLIAGGLSADNLAEAIRRYAPYGVDVSSGVEDRAGCKSFERMRAFVDAALDTREIA